MFRGLPLFLLISALAAMPLVDRELGQVAVGVLFALWILTMRTARMRGESAARLASSRSPRKVRRA